MNNQDNNLNQSMSNGLNNEMMGQPNNMGVNPNVPNMQPNNMGVNPNVLNMQSNNPGVNQFASQPNFQSSQMQQSIPVNGSTYQTSNKNNKFLIPIIVGSIVLVLMVALIFLLGSKDKTMVCTNKTIESGLEMNMEARINFKRNKAKDINMLITVDLGQYSEYKDTFLSAFEQEYSSYKQDGVEIDITSDDSKIYITATASNSNLAMLALGEKENYGNVKKELESQGFTCQ